MLIRQGFSENRFTMPNRSSDPLFLLIRSLTKAEKRNFKLYIRRNSSNENLKIVQLFDALDRMQHYDETALLKKNPDLKKQQLSNIKAHLYREVLASLRLLGSDDNIDIQLHEQLDYARLLYNKGLYHQSLKILDRLKETAHYYYQDSFLIQIISLEKKIETLHITRSMQDRADRLSAEAVEVNEKRKIITQLSNLALQLYSWYIKNGHARNEADEVGVKAFFREQLPPNVFGLRGFYERLYLHQCYCWYAFIRQDFIMYYRHTQKWVDLFEEQQHMIAIEPAHYIKGVHNLLNAHFDLRNYVKFSETLQHFQQFAESSSIRLTENTKIQVFVYLSTARINEHFMFGTFRRGLKMVPYIEEKLKEYELYLDMHRVLVFYYKIASLYFGNGDFETCIDWVNKIIQLKVDMRDDLQCYSRLLHLLAHYELGNYELMEPLTKSVYRFMAKMENLTIIEEEMFRFLRNNFHRPARQMKPHFKDLLQRIQKYEKSRFETRSFAYLDIISWLQSKAEDKSMEEIMTKKYTNARKRRYAPGAGHHLL